LASIRQRKKELQEEIDRIETTYSQKVSKLEGGYQSPLDSLPDTPAEKKESGHPL